MISLLLPMLAVAMPIQDAPADPLAPAREGKIRCIAPDMALKTCQSMVRYTVRGTDGFDAVVTGIVERDPVVLLRYSTFGRADAAGVCSMVRLRDFEPGALMRGGKQLSRADEQVVRLRLLNAVQPLAGKKRCYLDRPGEAGKREMTAVVTIDGVVRPEFQQTAIWVSPEEDFQLGGGR